MVLLCASSQIQANTQSLPKESLQAPNPWIKRTTGDCGFDVCIEIDFSLVPSTFEMTGDNPEFSDLFYLAVMDGPEPLTDPPNCVHSVPGQDGTFQCLFKSDKVKVSQSLLELHVTGPTPVGGTISVSQVSFFDAGATPQKFRQNTSDVNNGTLIKNGLFSIVAKTPNVPGTCIGIFTQGFPPPPVHWDEQDIEILTAHYYNGDDNVTAGMHLTNWNAYPANDSDRSVSLTVPFDYNPPSDFYEYSIFWDNKSTKYSFGDQEQVIKRYSSQSLSALSINNWSDGGWYWSQGPPNAPSVLYVKKITVYYNNQ